jgi:hypothetical protein
MGAFDDINLERTELWSTPPPRTAVCARIVAGVIALAVVVAGLAWWMRTRPAPSAELERMASSVTPAPRSGTRSPATSARTELPPPQRTGPCGQPPDRRGHLIALLSKWLATGNLARQMAALVEGAASGSLPLRFLAPSGHTGTFSVVERPGSHHDRARQLRPIRRDGGRRRRARSRHGRPRLPHALARLEEAHGELGEGDRSFDSALREGLRRLSETPIPDGPVAVTARGGVYGFADPVSKRCRRRRSCCSAAAPTTPGACRRSLPPLRRPWAPLRHIGVADALRSNCRLGNWLAVDIAT